LNYSGFASKAANNALDTARLALILLKIRLKVNFQSGRFVSVRNGLRGLFSAGWADF
jgi:hypothetical protein